MSAEIIIEKGIPITPAQNGRPSGSKYPVKEMEIGDSFLFTAKSGNSARSGMSRIFKAMGFGCVVRNEGKKFRVWRTK